MDIGTNGRISGVTGVRNKCILKTKLDNNKIKFSRASSLPIDVPFPFVLIGDKGFLTTKLLIPFPGTQCSSRKDRKIFNYRYRFKKFSHILLKKCTYCSIDSLVVLM